MLYMYDEQIADWLRCVGVRPYRLPYPLRYAPGTSARTPAGSTKYMAEQILFFFHHCVIATEC